jgi:DNA-binding MarR family transcriptional regulator
VPERPDQLVVGSVTLARVEREITVLLRRTFEEVWSTGYGDGPVDRWTYPVLALLDEHGPQGLTELTRRLGVTKPTVSRHVAKLGMAGLVTTRPDRDPRAVVVVLTPAGDEQVARVSDIRREGMRDVLAGWSDADSDTLALLLARLNHDLDQRR